ncbi:TetR/AcrR family transcriptional regulator [Microvirga pudoricolor]|uniref:TetR/AcrR family transcriptional regulator n=1 Tax=Microvirga pudoricolor TaxID=2778729 RepID=UPI00194E8789|nr:TetR/AcrR family transcriptional regulator [Microvirga pudoricolor]MBM6594997.1 TetR/AcrR family transcriptional regulator [Microvirga pudoricolor]
MRHWRGPFDRQGYHHGNLKEALIEAAQRFIAERGLGGFTLADAAKLVGVTPAALYRHFRGRDALVAEVAFRGFSDLAERLGRALKSDGTPLERFTRMGEAYLAFAEQEPGFYTAMFSPRPADGDPKASACDGKADKPSPPGAFDLLVKALSETFPDGFKDVDTRFIAVEVWALSHGIATLDAAGQLPKGPGMPDKYELLRAGVLALVHGALKRGA